MHTRSCNPGAAYGTAKGQAPRVKMLNHTALLPPCARQNTQPNQEALWPEHSSLCNHGQPWPRRLWLQHRERRGIRQQSPANVATHNRQPK